MLWVLAEAILLSTHNIGLYEDLTKIIFQLSSNTHLIPSVGLGIQQSFTTMENDLIYIQKRGLLCTGYKIYGAQ